MELARAWPLVVEPQTGWEERECSSTGQREVPNTVCSCSLSGYLQRGDKKNPLTLSPSLLLHSPPLSPFPLPSLPPSPGLSPNAADPGHRGEPGGQLVPAEGGAGVHGRHHLHTLKPHPLQLVVMETMVGQKLEE